MSDEIKPRKFVLTISEDMKTYKFDVKNEFAHNSPELFELSALLEHVKNSILDLAANPHKIQSILNILDANNN